MEKQETISLDKVIDSMKIGKPQVLLTLLFTALHGIEMADLASIILLGAVLRCDWHISALQASLLVTAGYVGMLPGGIACGYLGDRLGRRDLLIITNLITFLLSILIAVSPTIGWVFFLRILLGFCVSGSYALSSALLIELLPQSCRSKSMVGMFFGTSIGMLFANLVFVLFYPLLGWRWVTVFISLPVLFVSLVLFVTPRSPRFLHLANRNEEVLTVLRFLAGPDTEIPADKKIVVRVQSDERGNLLHVFNRQHCFTTVLLMIVFFGVAFSQIGGLTVVVYLPASMSHRCPKRFAQSTGDSDSSCCPLTGPTVFANTAWAAIGPVLFTIANLFVIDWIGRKKTMILCAIVATAALLCLNFCQPLVTVRVLMGISTGAIEALFATAYVYVGEYYPTSVRASAYGVCGCTARIGNILGIYPAQMFMLSIGPTLVLTIYATVLATVAVSAFLLPTETMGKRLTQTTDEEIDDLRTFSSDRKIYDTFEDKKK